MFEQESLGFDFGLQHWQAHNEQKQISLNITMAAFSIRATTTPTITIIIIVLVLVRMSLFALLCQGIDYSLSLCWLGARRTLCVRLLPEPRQRSTQAHPSPTHPLGCHEIINKGAEMPLHCTTIHPATEIFSDWWLPRSPPHHHHHHRHHHHPYSWFVNYLKTQSTTPSIIIATAAGTTTDEQNNSP